jgi:salicylate hydroxylase
VIGTDGLKSRVRQLLFGVDNPVSYPHYTHKIAYRALIPMPLAISRLGKSLALNQHMYGGPNAHLLTFPVAKQKLMNVVAFVSDPNEWPLERSMTQPARKEEIVDAFRCWGPTVREIIDLLGEVDSEWVDKWAVFDHFDHPAPYYASVVPGKGKGKALVCVAGDAAHASSPHHGAGAGIGVEDALALITVIDKAIRDIYSEQKTKEDALTAALKAYSDVRYERSQWLVRSSREVCGTYEWLNPEIGDDLEKGFEDVKERSHRIWDFDIDGMLTELERMYRSC